MSDHRPLGDAVDQEFRRLMSDIATVPGPSPELDELHSPVLTFEERTMNQGVRYGLIGAVAAAVAIIVGLVLFLGDGDDGGLETIEPPEETTSTTSTTTAAPGPSEGELLALAALALDPTAEGWSPEVFAPGATFGGQLAGFINDAERFGGWRASTLSNPDHTGVSCTTSEVTDEELIATCEEGYTMIFSEALGDDSRLTLSYTVEVGPDGITLVRQNSGEGPDVSDAVDRAVTAFNTWEDVYSPPETEGDPATDAWLAATVAESEDAAVRLRERVAEWAAYNERYGCTVDISDRCGPAAVALSVSQAFIRNEPDTLVELLGADAKIGGAISTVDEIPGRLDFEQAIGLLSWFTACQLETSTATTETLACRATVSSEASRSADVTVETISVRIEVGADSTVMFLERLPAPPSELTDSFVAQLEWIRQNHPADVGLILDADENPITTPEAIELWAAYTKEFVDSQG